MTNQREKDVQYRMYVCIYVRSYTGMWRICKARFPGAEVQGLARVREEAAVQRGECCMKYSVAKMRRAWALDDLPCQ